MNVKLCREDRESGGPRINRIRGAFTLIEVLVVITIIGVLITILGATVATTMRKAKEAATTALLQKIDALLDERVKGFDRATKSRDFQTIVNNRKLSLEAAGVFGVSPKVIAAIARKDFYKQLFPQRFEDLASPDANTNGIPDVLEAVPGVKLSVLITQTGAARHVTESSELLYFALTRMQSFGVPPVSESEFGDNEFRDTDGDGLMEFVDGWEQPLRFYRWPTRLLKPNGSFGDDAAPGTGGGSFLAYGTLGSDDVRLAPRNPPSDPIGPPRDMRPIGGLLIAGLPPQPAFPATQWDPLSEDPDDPYGLIATEMKRLIASGVMATASYNETSYPTLDTYHTALVVSAGADGVLGLYEPYVASDVNGDGLIDYGILCQPEYDATIMPASPYNISLATTSALADNLTNRNRRAGKGK
ncbi:MAG: type II secretion system protein [Planctomycetaceae bacterium]